MRAKFIIIFRLSEMNTMNSENQLGLDIVECCRRVYAGGFVASNDGNLSVRLGNDRFLATPAGKSKGFVRLEDLVVVDSKGRVVEGLLNATSEIEMHLTIYRERPDVRAVVHAHPIHATGFATANIELSDCVLAEIVTTLGSIPLAKYATPSTNELSNSIREVIRRADAVLLANHGVVTCGKDIYDAFFKMERVEHYAHILFVARLLGGEQLLSKEQVEKLEAIRPTYGTDSSTNPGCRVCGGDCVGADCSLYQDGSLQSSNTVQDLIRDVISKMKPL